MNFFKPEDFKDIKPLSAESAAMIANERVDNLRKKYGEMCDALIKLYTIADELANCTASIAIAESSIKKVGQSLWLREYEIRNAIDVLENFSQVKNDVESTFLDALENVKGGVECLKTKRK